MYTVPASANRVLKINPYSEEVEAVGEKFVGKQKWYGGISSNNGDMYCIPYGFNRVLKVSPGNSAKEVELIGPVLAPVSDKGTVGYGWHGGVHDPLSDVIYGFPSHGSGVLRIDCETDQVEVVGVVGNGEYKWLGGEMDVEGNVIGVPSDCDGVLKIKVGTGEVEVIETEVLEGGKKVRGEGRENVAQAPRVSSFNTTSLAAQRCAGRARPISLFLREDERGLPGPRGRRGRRGETVYGTSMYVTSVRTEPY